MRRSGNWTLKLIQNEFRMNDCSKGGRRVTYKDLESKFSLDEKELRRHIGTQ